MKSKYYNRTVSLTFGIILCFYVAQVNDCLFKEKSVNESLAAKFNHVYNKLATKMSLKVKSLTACRLVAKKLIRDNITLKKNCWRIPLNCQKY